MGRGSAGLGGVRGWGVRHGWSPVLGFLGFGVLGLGGLGGLAFAAFAVFVWVWVRVFGVWAFWVFGGLGVCGFRLGSGLGFGGLGLGVWLWAVWVFAVFVWVRVCVGRMAVRVRVLGFGRFGKEGSAPTTRRAPGETSNMPGAEKRKSPRGEEPHMPGAGEGKRKPPFFEGTAASGCGLTRALRG